MKMKNLNIYIIGLLTLMLCGIQSCALESEVFDEITPSIYPQTERDVRDLVTGNAYSPFQNYDYGGLYNVANGVMLISDMATNMVSAHGADGFGNLWNLLVGPPVTKIALLILGQTT